MASGEAEPLQYTTTVLRVSIHCEGCRKKVKKVLHNIEGVYKVAVDAAQHKVTVTGSVDADGLIRRLHKAGKQAALWPAPAPAPVVEAKKLEEVTPAPPAAGEGDVVKEGADKADAKPKEAAAKDKSSDKQQPEAEGKKKKPEKEKGADKKAENKADGAKPMDEPSKDAEVTAAKEKATPEPAKESAAALAAEEAGGEESSSGKKGKKKKSKQKDGGDGEAAAAEKTPQPPMPAPVPERPVGGFPYYAAQPVLSYNVAHPRTSVSAYYAPTPVGHMQPMPPPPPPPPQMAAYGYPPYPGVVAPPMPEFLYGPPGMRSPPPQESYNNPFNEENANSCSVM